jgi:hypothetical protein
VGEHGISAGQTMAYCHATQPHNLRHASWSGQDFWGLPPDKRPSSGYHRHMTTTQITRTRKIRKMALAGAIAGSGLTAWLAAPAPVASTARALAPCVASEVGTHAIFERRDGQLLRFHPGQVRGGTVATCRRTAGGFDWIAN